ncbi:MAG TPA: IPT/TIG domain-containing protein [Thermoanaerobaculia bacterium]|nr:IPT/TIG domain-containing protein [Thermoanaerobaculia bacterium]
MTLNASQTFQMTGSVNDTPSMGPPTFSGGGSVNLGSNNLNLIADSGGLIIDGPLSGTGTLFVDGVGGGLVTINNFQSAFLGATTVVGNGDLYLNGELPGTLSTTSPGARLNGIGTIQGATDILSGTISPGTSAGVAGNLTVGLLAVPSALNIAGNYSAELLGITTHDRIGVTGTVALSGTLTTSLLFAAPNGAVFVIIDNDGTDPVSGTFSGLLEGAVFTVNAQALKISYTGGDGNDVVLIRVSSPAIANLTPNNGPAVGGTAVTMTGSDFLPGATVTIAGAPVSNLVVVDANTITFVTPPGPSGPATVILTNPDGRSALSPVPFTYDSPSIANVTPSSGPVGTVVTISGVNFSGGVTSVTFNGVAASFTVDSDSQITATVPAGATTGPLVVTSGSFSSNAVTFTVACSDPPPTITASGPTDFCPPGSVTLTANTPTTPTVSSYLWSTGETTQSITVSTTGSYTVTVTYSNGCPATSAPQAVNVKAQPTVAISGPTSSCAGSTATLTASGSNISTFLWSPGGETTPSITVPVNAGSSSTYSVIVTSADGCVESASHTISPVSPQAINIDVPPSVTSGGTATASAQGTFTGPFTWTVLNGTILSGQGSSSIQFQAGTSGGVTIFVSSPDGACSADGSAVVQIIACSTSGPALNAPANNSTLTSPVTFSWSPVDGATSYEVYVAQGTSAPGLLGTTAGTSLSATVSSGPANWFVLARLAQSCSPNTTQSETRSFTATPATNCPTAGPVAISPSEGSRVFSPATFTWSSVSGVSGYRVLFSTNGGAFEDLGGILSPATTSIVAPVPPGDAVWYVEAIYSGCPAVASSAITFVVDPEDCSKHTSPSLLAPPSGSTVASSSVTFRWSSVEGADGYRVWNSVDGGDFETIGETPETMFTATIEPGAIQWFVEALFEGCESTFSPTQPFTVPLGANCAANQAPQLISPAAGQVTTAATVTFSWSSVGALEYELYLSVNSGTPTLVTKTPGTSFTTEVPEGDLEFFVRARFNGCPATTSGSRQFRYQPPANCGTELPVAISPQADTTGIPSPVTFRWSAVAGTTNYILTIASSSGVETIPTTSTQLTRPVSSGAGSWTVEAVFGAGCANTKSAASEFFVVVTPSGCTELAQPLIAAPSQISDRVSYFVQWQPVVGATSYQLQRSVGGSFENVVPLNLTETQASFTDTNEGTAPLTVLYRVRALSTTCTPLGVSAYSSVVGVTILPAVQTSNTTEGSTLRAQSETINYSIQLGPEFAGAAFSAMPTVPWLSVTPSSGTVPAAGINLQVTANTDDLPIGSSAGNVIVTLVTPDEVRTGGGLRQRASGTTSKTVPVNVNLVTPVTPNPKSGPPPDALIIPAVAHADGVNAQFQSDVRVTNTSPQVIKYQLTFTPTGAAGIAAGRQATIDIEPGRTVALDDVLKTWFGTGTTSALGTLEIRPLTKTAASTSSAAVKGLPNFVTFAASRTFSQTANGTFGQFIPAVPFANFLGRSSDPARPAVMSLQQIAQSAAFRTNLGLVEGSGQPATVNVSVFGDTGQKLTDFDVNLTGGQHMQLGSVLAQRGIQVNDGRLEVRVTSPGGKVTAYASVLDNRTNDSLLVTPVSLNEVGNTKFVLPGVAELSGGIPWQTDARLFNASDVAVNAQLTLQPLIGTEALTANVTLAPREVRQFDRILSTLFGVTNDGGALHIATTANANLIATARTYRPDGTGGSFGQFITAVTPNEAVAVGNRPLQILQVEESVRYRSNIGLAEVTGQAAMVEVTAIPPDSKFSITIRVPMDGNQFRQLNSLLRQMGLSDTHNARVSVRVVGGQGRVTAYASVIDNVTADPTFVPAQ